MMSLGLISAFLKIPFLPYLWLLFKSAELLLWIFCKWPSFSLMELVGFFSRKEIQTQTTGMTVWCDDHYSIATPFFYFKYTKIGNTRTRQIQIRWIWTRQITNSSNYKLVEQTNLSKEALGLGSADPDSRAPHGGLLGSG